MSTFTYSFEELPLVIHNGIEAGLINGAAEIRYSRDGSWHTEAITVEGFGERDAAGKRQWPQVPAPAQLAAMIVRRLENEWESRVDNAVAEQIEEDRICAADDYADMRRQERILERLS
jgi:hypothetical protein